MRHKQQDTRQATGKGIVIHGVTVPFFCLLAAMRGGGLAAAAVVMMAVTGWFKSFVQERRVPEWLTGKRK